MPTFSLEVGSDHTPKIGATARYYLVHAFDYAQEVVDQYTDYQCAQEWTKRFWQEEVARYEGTVAGQTEQQTTYAAMEPVPEP